MTDTDTEYCHEFELSVPLPGTPADVFVALTEPDALRAWFAEHVDIDLRTGGAFRFWGRHTLGTPAAADATQTVVALDSPHSLKFTWHILDRDSVVRWSVREDTDADEVACRLSVEHCFESMPDVGRAKEFIDDLWRIHTGGLLFHMKGLNDIYRPNFADPDPVVRSTIVIEAPPARVFAALTEPEQISQWFPAPAPVVEPRVGGTYGFGFSYEVDGETVEPPPMTILEFEDNRRLAITWPDWRGDASVPDQTVTWLLEDLGDGRTRLTLEHSGFTRAVDVSDYPFGWAEFLDKIGEVAEAA